MLIIVKLLQPMWSKVSYRLSSLSVKSLEAGVNKLTVGTVDGEVTK